jgi:hypothetical protein
MNETRPETYAGGCLCGAVRYQISGTPVVVARCHCEKCQKVSGAGHTVGAMFADKALHLRGELGEFQYRSNAGNEVTKSFCPRCGSPMLGRNTGMKGYVTVPLGSMDDSSSLRSDVAISTRNRKPWDTLDTDIPCFEAQPDWKPDRGT